MADFTILASGNFTVTAPFEEAIAVGLAGSLTNWR
jgi:hypothetical protein